MKTYKIAISEPGVSEKKPYVYVIYTTEPEGYVYVGETEDRNGAIGRLAGHIKVYSPGTFISRYIENSMESVSELKDIKMIAFDIGEYEIFSGDINKTKRRALEYLLHYSLLEYSSSMEVFIPYNVISFVQAQERYINDKNIRMISEKLFMETKKIFPFNKEV